MKTLALLASLVLLTAGCCALTGCSTVMDYSTLALYAVQRKELVFTKSPCGGPLHPKNPYMVSAWIREGDLKNAVVVCKPDCTDCRIEIRRKK